MNGDGYLFGSFCMIWRFGVAILIVFFLLIYILFLFYILTQLLVNHFFTTSACFLDVI
jgi:hypothetical protein